ncbi:MAG: fibronectin type III domain-containing protein, partial [Deltaproteobacteria bacterium]|nr:fibronectin type III domain-containing protein [Deltaproteobacteria bacterium]
MVTAFALSGGDFSSSTSATVTSTLTGTPTEMWISGDVAAVAGGAPNSWVTYAASKAITLTSIDGRKTVNVLFRDAAGNQTSTSSDAVTLDTVAPAGYLVVAGGAEYTTSTSVALAITAIDSNGATLMKLGNDSAPDCSAAASYVAFSASVSAHTLPSTEGGHTVHVCLKDAAGNFTATALGDAIALDSSDPSGTVVINSGAASTTSADVNLAFTGTTAGVTQMRVSNSALTCNLVTDWVPYQSALSHRLSCASGNTCTVYACLKDPSGRVSALLSDTIDFDNEAPVVTAFALSGGDFSSSTSATLTSTLTGTPSEMLISGDVAAVSGGSPNAWVPYAASKAITLTSIDERKTVNVVFRDAAGNLTSTYSDSVTLDTVAPTGYLVVAGGAEYTTSTSVALAITAIDANGATLMKLGNDSAPDCSAAASYVAFAASVSAHTLPATPGQRSVYACLRDAAGNYTATAFSDAITLDSSDPTGTVVINSGAAATTVPDVTVAISGVPADVAWMKIGNSSLTCSAVTDWTAFALSSPWHLSCASGTPTCTVYVCLKDAAGRLSSALSSSIAYDADPPAVSSFAISAGDYTNTITGALAISATGTTRMRVWGDLDPSTGVKGAPPNTWIAFDAAPAIRYSAGDGLKILSAQFSDDAGNLTSVYTDTTTLDRVAPTGTVSIGGGATYTTSSTVSVAFTGSDDRSTTAQLLMKNANDAAPDCSIASGYSAFAASVANWGLISTDGSHSVHMCLKDAAGNYTAVPASDSITLDSTPPTPHATTPIVATGKRLDLSGSDVDDTSATYKADVVLTLRATGATRVAVSNTAPSCASATFSPATFTAGVATVSGHQLTSGTGTKTVYVCFADDAGNYTSSPSSTTIYLDQSAPTGLAFNIGAGTDYVTASPVGLTGITCADESAAGLTRYMRFSNCSNVGGGAGCNSIGWTALASSYASWSLTPNDGSKVVFMQVRDYAGNVAVAVVSAVTLDSTAPQTPSVVIDNGALVTSSDTVNLVLSAADALSGISEMYLSRNGTFTDNTWETFVTTKSFDINGSSTSSESRTVYLRVRDLAGNTSGTGTDTIVVDLHAPTLSAVSINAAAARTSSTMVSVVVTATDTGAGTLAEVMLSEDAAFAGASWTSAVWTGITPKTTTRSFTLSSQNEEKTLYVKVRDAALRESSSLSDQIVLDTQAPTIQSFTTSTPFPSGSNPLNTTFAISATDNMSPTASLMMCRHLNSPLNCTSSCSSWVSWSASPTWAFTLNSGANTVALCLRDEAGNVTPTPATVTVVRDTSAPTAPLLATPVAEAGIMRLAWTAGSDPESGIRHYEVHFRSSRTGAAETIIQPIYTTSYVLEQLRNYRPYDAYVVAVNGAGLTSSSNTSSAEAIPGWRQADLLDFSYNETNRKFFEYNDVLYIGRALSSGSGTTNLKTCNTRTRDCINSDSWTSADINTDAATGLAYSFAFASAGQYPTPGLYQLYGHYSGGTGVDKVKLRRCDLYAHPDCSKATDWGLVGDVDSGTAGDYRTDANTALIYDGARMLAAYPVKTLDGFGCSLRTLRTGICKTNSAYCSAEGDWTKVEHGALADANSVDAKLVSDRLMLAWVDTDFGGTATCVRNATDQNLHVSVCQVDTDCDATADWTGYVVDPNTGPDDHKRTSPKLATDGTTVWLAYREFSDYYNTDKLFVASCNLVSTQCDSASDWAYYEMPLSGAWAGDPIGLSWSRGSLHLAWGRYGRLHYASCDSTTGCNQPQDWNDYRSSALTPQLLFVGAYDSMANWGHMLVRETDPYLLIAMNNHSWGLLQGAELETPGRFAAGPSIDQTHVEWQPVGTASGYDVRFGTASRSYTNLQSVGPSIQRLDVSASVTSPLYFAETGRKSAQYSDPTREIKARKFTSFYDGTYSGWYTSGRLFGVALGDPSDGVPALTVHRRSSSEYRAHYCNTAPCDDTSSWNGPGYTLFSDPSVKFLKGASGSGALALASWDGTALSVRYCDPSSGCTTDTAWTKVDFPTTDLVAMDITANGSRMAVATCQSTLRLVDSGTMGATTAANTFDTNSGTPTFGVGDAVCLEHYDTLDSGASGATPSVSQLDTNDAGLTVYAGDIVYISGPSGNKSIGYYYVNTVSTDVLNLQNLSSATSMDLATGLSSVPWTGYNTVYRHTSASGTRNPASTLEVNNDFDTGVNLGSANYRGDYLVVTRGSNADNGDEGIYSIYDQFLDSGTGTTVLLLRYTTGGVPSLSHDTGLMWSVVEGNRNYGCYRASAIATDVLTLQHFDGSTVSLDWPLSSIAWRAYDLLDYGAGTLGPSTTPGGNDFNLGEYITADYRGQYLLVTRGTSSSDGYEGRYLIYDQVKDPLDGTTALYVVTEDGLTPSFSTLSNISW